MQKPDLLSYIDILQFLRDSYQYSKKIDSHFSYAKWSAALNFNNKTLLRLILLGKRRITPKTRESFKKYFNFEQLQQRYFDILVDYSQACTSSQKQIFGQKLIAIQRSNFSQPLLDPDSGVLQDVFSPIILTLLSSTEFAISFEELQKKTQIAKDRLNIILFNLISAGLVVNKNNNYISTKSTFKIADHFGNHELKKYYQYWIEHSIQAMNLPFDLRRFRSLQILLSKEEFEQVNNLFQEFVINLLSRYENNKIEERRVYMFNSMLFPVTDA